MTKLPRDDRLLPYSETAERAVLGSLILEAKIVRGICADVGITSDSLYVPAHQMVFQAIAGMNGSPVDTLTACHRLKELGSLEQVGGESFVERLIDETPTAANARHYCQIVKRHERERDLIRAARHAEASIYDGTPLEEVLAETSSAVSALTPPDAGANEFPAITLSDLQSYKADPARDHIAGLGWLRRGAMTLFTGATGIGKSVAIKQICISAASGQPIFGRIAVAHPRKVVLLQAENDMETMQRDTLAIVAGIGADQEAVNANMVERWVYALSGNQFLEYFSKLLERDRPDLIAVDNYQAFSGTADINSTYDWSAWYRPLIKAVSLYGASLLLVDHTTKPQVNTPKGGNAATGRQSVYSAAGTSLKANAARTSCELSEDAQADRRFRLRFGKNAERTGILDSSGYVVRDIYLEHSDNPSRPYWRVSMDQFGGGGKFDKAIQQALDGDSDMSAREIGKLIGCEHTTVTRARIRMGI